MKNVLSKAGSKQSKAKVQPHNKRANITLSVDDSVIDRVGKRLRCTYSWYSGRWKKVVKGQNLLGIVLTINGKVLPLHLLFCSKQGSKNTDKPSLLLSMLTRLKEEFAKHDIDLSTIPLTMDSWYVSEPLKQALHELGFTNIVVVGKGSYVFSDGQVQYTASQWKKEIEYDSKLWGIKIPAQRKTLTSPTFGRVNLLFFQKSSTRAYYLMDFSTNSLRSAQMWRCWLAHNLIEQFWKILKSVLSINSMRLRDDGLYTGLLIKIIAYLWLTSFQYLTRCRHLSLTQIMRQIRREAALMTLLKEHFHLDFLGIPALD